MRDLIKNWTKDMIKPKKNLLMIQILKMDKKKRNQNQRDLQVLVFQAVVVKVKRVMREIINIATRKMIKLKQNL